MSKRRKIKKYILEYLENRDSFDGNGLITYVRARLYNVKAHEGTILRELRYLREDDIINYRSVGAKKNSQYLIIKDS